MSNTNNEQNMTLSLIVTNTFFLLLFARTKFYVVKNISKINAREKDASYKINRARENSKHVTFDTRICEKIDPK